MDPEDSSKKYYKIYGAELETQQLVNIIKQKYSLDDLNNFFNYKKDLLPNSILLSGPPGTGKTTLLEYQKILFKDKIHIIDLFELLDKQTTDQFNAFNFGIASQDYFNSMKNPNNTDNIYLIDNIEMLNTYFVDYADNINEKITISRVLKYLQDLVKPEYNNTIIATASNPSALDPDLINFFEKEIKLNYPNQEARFNLLKSYLNDIPLINTDLTYLANMTNGLNGRDIIKLCKNAYNESINNNHKSGIFLSDFNKVFNNAKMQKNINIKQLRYIKTKESDWNDLGGIKGIIEQIQKDIILPLKYADRFEKHNISLPKGILLYGPPGTGKTTIAKILANESGFSFFSFSGSDILGKYVGESEKNIKNYFKEAKENAPSIIFIDEIENLGSKRDNDINSKIYNSLIDELLHQMDGINELKNVIVIGATNVHELLDPALLRSGRFDRKYEIPLPDLEGRKEIFEIYINKFNLSSKLKENNGNKEEFISHIAENANGFSGADIENLCSHVASEIVYKEIKDIENKPSELNNETAEQIFNRLMFKNRIKDEKHNEIGFIKSKDMLEYQKENEALKLKNKLRTKTESSKNIQTKPKIKNK